MQRSEEMGPLPNQPHRSTTPAMIFHLGENNSRKVHVYNIILWFLPLCEIYSRDIFGCIVNLDFCILCFLFYPCWVHVPIKATGWVLYSPSRDQVCSGHVAGTHRHVSEFSWLNIRLKCVLDDHIWLQLNERLNWEHTLSFGCSEHSGLNPLPYLLSRVKLGSFTYSFLGFLGFPGSSRGSVLSPWYDPVEYLLAGDDKTKLCNAPL